MVKECVQPGSAERESKTPLKERRQERVRATPSSSSADKGVAEHFRPFPGASVSSLAKGGIGSLWPSRLQSLLLRHELHAILPLLLPTNFGVYNTVVSVKAEIIRRTRIGTKLPDKILTANNFFPLC